ncbi:murein L,D-transpeptidase YcbB/YkuD [Roseospira visakhapatnamensis]|uniref:Murein L,D-transpeptidase YcbB/YkuD n=1 Tax=Roseospira visakhapatnamensis TaxID=390880 RepID=A0A7W6W9R5_9PROT|nr:L,D-transpeptidase family protein [Roseospira visakhapatnamensis]MBB4265712.1 murein L,D-transpeptidase YcbB/YkuD [Roseospira visakhapatnamensis]
MAVVVAGALLAGCVTAGGGGGASMGAALGGSASHAMADGAARSSVEEVLRQDPATLGARTATAVRAFYQQRQNTPAWTDARGLTALGRQVRAVLDTAWVDGVTGAAPLPPVARETPAEARTRDAGTLARLDVALTTALTDYVQRATTARRTAAAGGVAATLAQIARDDADAERPGTLFRVVSAEDRQARLRRAVLDYEALARAGGWPTPPATGVKLEPGAVHPDIALVRAQLIVTGDHAGATPPNPALYDAALAASVRRFQARHGLSEDAKIGKRTREALSRPVEHRLQQMALNLKRLRDIPAAPVGRSVEVNIAGSHLEGRDNGITTFQTDVIVGRRDRPTPELSSAINRMVLNPTWTVPTTIAEKDILPKVRRDPSYLTRAGFTVYSGWDGESEVLDPTTIDWSAEDVDIRALRLRQAPGGGNALGNIKFMFPNRHDVYLHSTPSRGLFARSQRTFSSGCVRVRDPMDFAAFLMNTTGHTAESVAARIRKGGTQTVRPPSAVPLSIVYVTAWVDTTNTVHFRRDIYGHDARQMPRIAQRPPTPVAAPPRVIPTLTASETPVPVSAPGPALVTETAEGSI